MQILQVQRQKLAQPEEIYSVCAFFQQCQWLFCIYVDNEDNSRFIMELTGNSEFFRVLISFLPSCRCVECWVGLPAQTSDPFTSPWSFCPRRDSWGAENSRHQFLCNAACQHFGPDDQQDEEDRDGEWVQTDSALTWTDFRLVGRGGAACSRVGLGPAAGQWCQVGVGARYCAHLGHHLASALPTSTWTTWPLDPGSWSSLGIVSAFLHSVGAYLCDRPPGRKRQNGQSRGKHSLKLNRKLDNFRV